MLWRGKGGTVQSEAGATVIFTRWGTLDATVWLPFPYSE